MTIYSAAQNTMLNRLSSKQQTVLNAMHELIPLTSSMSIYAWLQEGACLGLLTTEEHQEMVVAVSPPKRAKADQ